ncbi:2-phosphosulfolactate phosphatase [Saccharomonospora sp. NPDC046836]|uniref:2-phosphosulfolactate phosphatase n=1 Tax=Saccharomonospora sp. NPDC046836 TaxID=3156921 RepID=UPI003403346D
MRVFEQDGYAVRLEWGAEGIAALAAQCAVLVVVDVLSFSTRVDLAVAGGEAVVPVRWDAEPPPGPAVALRSPNGATLSADAAAAGAHVFTACLRNAAAVAQAALPLAGNAPIGVIPAGERWGVHVFAEPGSTGPLRPCVEDHLGAGTVVTALTDLGAGPASPEALLAALSVRAAGSGLAELVRASASGRELRGHGHGELVDDAVALGASRMAPRLVDGQYRHG